MDKINEIAAMPLDHEIVPLTAEDIINVRHDIEAQARHSLTSMMMAGIFFVSQESDD